MGSGNLDFGLWIMGFGIGIWPCREQFDYAHCKLAEVLPALDDIRTSQGNTFSS